jgi:sarcosine oxidase
MDGGNSFWNDHSVATDYDVIVVGVGGMGSAVCYHLARRGVRVLGIERFGIPNTLGSSHGFSRMIRMAYFEHADYVPLLRRAFGLWEELERASGGKLFYKVGGIYMGRPSDPAIAGALASARMHGLPHELLSREDLASRYPQFCLPDDFVGMWEENAGLLVPEKCVEAFARLAREAGAEILENEEALEWGEGWVRTSGGEYRAKEIVFTAGPWTSKLVRELGVKLVVTRQVMGWVWPKKPELFELGRLPVWAIGHADGSLHYGFPMLPDGQGFKVAWHHTGEVTDPDTVRRETSAADEEEFRSVLREMIPEADGKLAAMRTCLYTNSPDHHFVLDRVPGMRGVTVACGFSGHGFKFASVIGEILADWVTKGRTDLPVGFLGMGRFSSK